MPSQPKLVAKSLVINDKNQCLVLVRSDSDMERPGEADLPGGGVDPGETPQLAVVREIKEEVNLTADPDSITLVYTDARMKGQENVIRSLFVVTQFEGDVELSEEHTSYTWSDLHNAPAILGHPVWSTAIQYAIDNRLT